MIWSLPSRFVCRFLAAALFAGVLSLQPCGEAQANSGSWGSHGSSGGSWGSSGGGYSSSGGSYGSSGGLFHRRPVRSLLGRLGSRVNNLLHPFRGRRAYGSSGGSIGNHYVSYGSSGGSSGYSMPTYYGSSGGSSGGMATMLDCYPSGTVLGSPAMLDVNGNPVNGDGNTIGPDGSLLNGGAGEEYYPTNPANSPGGNANPAGGNSAQPDDSTMSLPVIPADQAILELEVPEQARVYINDRLTRTPGRLRSYESNDLVAGRDYFYQVKVEYDVDGVTRRRSKMVTLRPGNLQTVSVDFDQPAITTLALNVPEDAEVKLCGQETTQTGGERKFITTRLEDGEVCRDYTIEVAYLKDGKRVTDVRKIDLGAGELRTVSFGESTSDVNRVAAR